MILNSIRWRIQLWHAALLTCVVVGFGVTAYRLAAISRLGQIDQELQGHVAQLTVAVPPPSAVAAERRTPPRPGQSIPEQITSRGAYFVVWNHDGSVQTQSANAPREIERPERRSPGDGYVARTRGVAREVGYFTNVGRCFLVGRGVGAEMGEMRRLAWYLGAAGGAVLMLGLLGGWWLATRAIRPIEVISQTAERIADGSLATRIPVAAGDNELTRLAGVLNSTFARLDTAFAQQRRFTADAAHELRTPVTAVLMHAKNGLESEGLSEEQREAFHACYRSAQRMKRLIDSLLELARFDARVEPLARETCDLAEIARDCVDLLRPLVEAKGIFVREELAPAPCLGDTMRLMQVVTNLLTNAIHFTPVGREIYLTTRGGEEALFTIEDSGPGFPANELPSLFERFHRGDTARNSATGGSGLGLAICKAIVEAHGGRIKAEPGSEVGARFLFWVPEGS